MEIHKFICDHCGSELGKTKVTISQHYSYQSYDGLDEEYYTETVNNVHHLCPKCWDKFKNLILTNGKND